MAKPWIKLWHDLLADTTIQRWPAAQRYCWAAALLIASQAKVEGHLTDSSGDPFTVADLSSQLNVDWHTAARFLERAEAAGKLARTADGVLYVVNWEKRQRSTVGAIVDRSLRTRSGRSSDNDRTILGINPTRTSKDRARGKKQEADLAVTLANESRDAGPRLPVDIFRLEAIAERLTGSNEKTPRALATVLEGMTEFDLDRALAKTRRARPRNEAAYLVGTLKRFREEPA